jgi:O-antigen/teichoic acid export membrane protein
MQSENGSDEPLAMFEGRLIASSLLLFVDLTVVSAIGGWFYWLMISKVTFASDIGQATAVYSLVNLAAALASLGLEYPLLKRSCDQRSGILGTTILLQLVVTIASIPLIIYILNTVYHESHDVVLIAIVILITWPIILATRYAILGISKVKTILIIDIVSTALKFISGFVLVSLGFGPVGILGSIMIYNISAAAISLYVASRIYGFSLSRIVNVFSLIKEGLANILSIVSRTLIYTLSIVLLAAIGIDNAEIGTFYIVLIISLLAGGLITSSAYMLIPFSSTARSDLSSGSTRIALSFTVPIVAILISSPEFLLSLIGQEYVSGRIALFILSIGILPFSLTTMSISRFNFLGDLRKLVTIGAIQIICFVIPFLLLTPKYGILGTAISVVLSYISSSVPCMVWSERALLRYTINSLVAVAASGTIGYAINTYYPNNLNSLLAMVASLITSLLIVITLKNTTLREIKDIILSIRSGGETTDRDSKQIG